MLEGMLSKFLKGFFMLSARQKIRFFNSMLAAEYNFSIYFRMYLIPNNEAHIMAKVMMEQCFNV